MTIRECDLLVVGGGPGGYTAAIRGAQKGLKTVLVERQHLGGTCLNRGCIPTKTLLEDTLMISAVRGCYFMRGDMKINLKRIVERKNMVVEGSRNWIRDVLSGNGITLLLGEASFTGSGAMAIKTQDGVMEEVGASKIILATGAETNYGPGLKVDGQRILSTDDALALKSIPNTLAVVGAGNRGVEFASIYHNLGARVVIIEKEKRILPRVHWELADRYEKTLVDRQIKVLTRTKAVGAHPTHGNGVTLNLKTAKGQQEIQVDMLLLTGVRRPAYQGLNLDAAGPPYLAHKAIAQGMVAVDQILGIDVDKGPLFVPNCLYGDPEVASLGMTEDEALKTGKSVKVGEFYFIGNGRFGTMGNEQGMVIIVFGSETGAVLGVHMIGPQVTELISLASLAMRNGIDVDGIKKRSFPIRPWQKPFSRLPWLRMAKPSICSWIAKNMSLKIKAGIHTLAARAIINPQTSYGEDVISRIYRVLKSPSESTRMQQLAVRAINKLGDELCKAANAESEEIVDAVITGNTVMHHSLLGLPIRQLAYYPFVPAVREALDIKASDVGMDIALGSYVHLLPNIAGFVGGDHTAALLACLAVETEEVVVVLDIGTNTEVSLIDNGKITSESCVSGPAFEGGHIKDGMRAASGAIERLRITSDRVQYQTINETPPVGICGSGILDAMAQLYLAGVLDKSGRMNDNHSRMRSCRKQCEFVLVREDEREGRLPIVITQRDVRELQLAKAAIRAGIQVLLETKGRSEEEIGQIIIVGSFGSYIDVASAVTIGMLPSLPPERFHQVGNAAGMGAKLALISSCERTEARAIASRINYIELASASAFKQSFIQASSFGIYRMTSGRRKEII